MHQHYLYLTSFEPERAHIISFDSQGNISQNRADSSLSSLAQMVSFESNQAHIDKHRCHIILSDHLVSSYELDLNIKNRQQLEKAARYAIEDQLPLNLDHYHIITTKSSKESASVRCIANERFAYLLSYLEQLGLNVQSVTVESDLLNNNEANLVVRTQSSSLKSPAYKEVLEFDNDLLPLLSERIFDILADDSELNIIYDPDQRLVAETIATQAPESLRIRNILRDHDYFTSLTEQHKTSQNYNLLQGLYKPTHSEQSEKNNWLYPGILALISGFIFTGGLVAQNIYLDNKISNQEQQLIENYSNLYPQKRKPRDINELSNFIRGSGSDKSNSDSQSNAHLLLLEAIANSSNQHSIQLIGFTFERNQCDLVITGASVESINQYKNSLEADIIKNGGKTVELSSVNAKDDKYQGNFKIMF